VDLRPDDDEAAFRDEVRSFLDEHLPEAWRVVRLDNDLEQGDEDVRRAWQRVLFEHGWLQLTWPTDEGGRGATPMMEAIYQSELARAGAPPIWGRAGAYLLAPTLVRHATDAQRKRFVDPILSGELFFCQAFSEPGSGSDLASLATTATRTAGGWLLNGQKCWSSGAMHADRAFLLARTGPAGERHRAIGFFLVDLDQPGVDIRPTKQASGHSEFAEIFLDDVFVDDDDLLGAPNEGWAIAMTTFSFERAAIANAMLLERSIHEVLALARSTASGDDPVVRQQLARAYASVRIFAWLSYRDLTRYGKGEVPGAETSLSKLGWTETAKDLRRIAVDLRGMHGVLQAPDEEAAGPWLHLWMWSAAQTIYGGTSEVQRNIVAERMLGLPRA
jgi:alkylation response protein AidB-like acyl-CoA dehydrogenase